MKRLITSILLFISIVTVAQRPNSDMYSTKNGNLIIQPILHGTLVIEWNNFTVYIDPYGGSKAFKEIETPDLIIITDIHGDPLNQETLDLLNTKKAKFIVPQAVADKISSSYQNQLLILDNNQEIKELGIGIKAIPMYNLREEAKTFHTKGRGNGYILNFGGKRIYISGDTEDILEMRQLKNIDIAFVCMNLPYTMNIDKATEAVLEFKPKIVYPYHYRGKPDISDINKFKKLVNNVDPNIDVKLRNWYPEYE